MPNIIKGNTLMLFIKENGHYNAIAFAKTHELTIDSTKDEVHSRLHDNWTDFILTSGSWSISCEALYSDDADKLFDLFADQEKLTCMFGLASNYTTSGIADTNASWAIANGYRGKAWIKSLDIEATTGETATLKIELEGTSPIKKANVNDEDTYEEPAAPALEDPVFEFTVSQSQAQNSSNGEYKISDYTNLLNPDDLPTRYIIDRFDGRIS